MPLPTNMHTHNRHSALTWSPGHLPHLQPKQALLAPQLKGQGLTQLRRAAQGGGGHRTAGSTHPEQGRGGGQGFQESKTVWREEGVGSNADSGSQLCVVLVSLTVWWCRSAPVPLCCWWQQYHCCCCRSCVLLLLTRVLLLIVAGL
jgi:hypothetical protein